MKKPRHRGFTILELAVVLVVLVALASLLVMKAGQARENADEIGTRATLNTIREAFVGSPSAPGYLADMKYVPGFNAANVRIGDLFNFDSSRFPPLASPYDIVAQRGWRGPYLSNVPAVRNTNPARYGLFPGPMESRFSGDPTFFERHFYTDSTSTVSPYGVPGEGVIADLWGNPIVLQIPPTTAFKNPVDDATRFRYARIVSAGADGILSTPLEDPVAGMHADGKTKDRGDDYVLFLNRADIYEEP